MTCVTRFGHSSAKQMSPTTPTDAELLLAARTDP
ncbi:MAG: hypothetical protein QOD86_456, partial [Miltoncostaeaceae bacterium]|nr:hypothetical protein [Miltoncostaeaceae bacterium]